MKIPSKMQFLVSVIAVVATEVCGEALAEDIDCAGLRATIEKVRVETWVTQSEIGLQNRNIVVAATLKKICTAESKRRSCDPSDDANASCKSLSNCIRQRDEEGNTSGRVVESFKSLLAEQREIIGVLEKRFQSTCRPACDNLSMWWLVTVEGREKPEAWNFGPKTNFRGRYHVSNALPRPASAEGWAVERGYRLTFDWKKVNGEAGRYVWDLHDDCKRSISGKLTYSAGKLKGRKFTSAIMRPSENADIEKSGSKTGRINSVLTGKD